MTCKNLWILVCGHSIISLPYWSSSWYHGSKNIIFLRTAVESGSKLFYFASLDWNIAFKYYFVLDDLTKCKTNHCLLVVYLFSCVIVLWKRRYLGEPWNITYTWNILTIQVILQIYWILFVHHTFRSLLRLSILISLLLQIHNGNLS